MCLIKSEFVKISLVTVVLYPGADKSLGRPGSKQGQKHIRDEHDFNNIETRKFCFLQRQGAEGNSRHSDRNISLCPSRSGKGLISTPVLKGINFYPYFPHPLTDADAVRPRSSFF